jgi:hypothetical protein
MAVTRADLTGFFPEFEEDDATLQAVQTKHINEAEEKVDQAVMGNSFTYTVCLLAAQSLALTPYGQEMRLSTKEGKTVYDDRLENILELKGSGEQAGFTAS